MHINNYNLFYFMGRLRPLNEKEKKIPDDSDSIPSKYVSILTFRPTESSVVFSFSYKNCAELKTRVVL